MISVDRSLRIAIFDQKSPRVTRPMSIADPKRTFELPEPDPHSLVGFPRPGILLDSALGTFDVENVLKERMHVQPEETRCRGIRRSPQGD